MFNFLRRYRIYFIYLPLFLYWVILLIATSLPAPDLPDVWGGDKIKHYLAYLVLAFLLNLALFVQEKHPLSIRKSVILTVAICFFYGLFDEIHQIFIPGRSGELLDLVADILGAVTGALLVLYLVRKNSYNHA